MTLAGAGLGALLFQPLHRSEAGTFIGASAAEFGFTFFVVAPLVNDWVRTCQQADCKVVDCIIT
jgi:hypothetical protein